MNWSVHRGREGNGAGCRDGGRPAGRHRGHGYRGVLHRTGQQVFVFGGGHFAILPLDSLPHLGRREATSASALCQPRFQKGQP